MQAAADIHRIAGLKQLAQKDEKAALHEAAKQFEALFVQILLKQMRQASPGDPLLGGSQGQLYRELYDSQLALHLAERKNLGIAKMLTQQLSRYLPPPKETTTPALPWPESKLPSSEPAAQPSPPAQHPIPERFTSPQEFIRTLWPDAQQAAAKTGIDPKLLLAQAALETGWGKKILHHPDGRSSHNLFNIKTGQTWSGESVQVETLEYQDGVAVRKRAAFRAYADYRQSFEDYLRLLHSPRYAEALSSAHDPKRFLNALAKAGYATDPNYAVKVLAIYQHEETLAAL